MSCDESQDGLDYTVVRKLHGVGIRFNFNHETNLLISEEGQFVDGELAGFGRRMSVIHTGRDPVNG
jgi:hypothetical protein